jgi:hypothetical protein
MSDMNCWFLTISVPLNWVTFGMSLLMEVSKFQRISLLHKGKLRTDGGWNIEDGKDENT